MRSLKITILTLLLWLAVIGGPNPAQAQEDAQEKGAKSAAFVPIAAFYSGLAMGTVAYSHTEALGLLNLLMVKTSLQFEEWPSMFLFAASSYYNLTVLPKELQEETELTERRLVRQKAFRVNFITFAASVFLMDLSKKGVKEKMQVADSYFFLTPQDDSWAMNYHLRF